tara:strand:- start:77 stop:673 length:597 start_codon:yes stop_codon:yes gene_type:complete
MLNLPRSTLQGAVIRMHESNQLSDKEAKEHLQRLEALFATGQATSAPAIPYQEKPSNTASGPQAPGRPMRAGMRKPSAQKVFANPRKSIGRAPSEFRMRLERLRIARSPEEIKEAADQFLEHHQLPDDPDVLLKVLQHPAERVLREAMGQLSSLLMQGRWEATLILEDRLNDLSSRVEEAATISFVEGLRSQLQSLKN